MEHIPYILYQFYRISQDLDELTPPGRHPLPHTHTQPGWPYLCQVHQGVGLIVEFPLLHLHTAQSGGSREGGVIKRRRRRRRAEGGEERVQERSTERHVGLMRRRKSVCTHYR